MNATAFLGARRSSLHDAFSRPRSIERTVQACSQAYQTLHILSAIVLLCFCENMQWGMKYLLNFDRCDLVEGIKPISTCLNFLQPEREWSAMK